MSKAKLYAASIALLTIIFGFNDRLPYFDALHWTKNFIMTFIAVAVSFLITNYSIEFLVKKRGCSFGYEFIKTRMAYFKAKFPFGIVMPLLVTLASNGLWYFPMIASYKFELKKTKLKKASVLYGWEKAFIYFLPCLFYFAIYNLFWIISNLTQISFEHFLLVNFWMAVFMLLPIPKLPGCEVLFSSLPFYIIALIFLISGFVVKVLLFKVIILLLICIAIYLAFSERITLNFRKTY